MGHDEHKKTAIIILSSILLVAMVVAIVIVSDGDDSKKKAKLLASEKAITAICQTTDYQKPCFESLHGHNSTDPKELIQAAMQATIGYINDALRNITALRQIQTDPRTKSALDTCTELSNRAIYDLQRSLSNFKQFDITNVDDILLELKTWVSGAMTHQETCLDGFENLKGDAGGKMRGILTKSMQMTSNALAMVAEISTFLEYMGIQGYKKSSRGSRRLLSNDQDLLGSGSSWVNEEKRRLLQVHAVKIKPNIIVAKDGSGKYKTINEAVKDIPRHNNKTFVLYIKQGVYTEHLVIETPFTNVMMIGDGPTKTRITGRLNFVDGVGTYQSATVAVHGDNFIARDIGFENSAGAEKHQAVALRASADKMIFFNCHIEGYQDTLYTHAYRQFYRDCLISGTVDFIFGDSAAIFQGCTILFRKPLKDQQNIVTAQGRMDERQPTALVLQNCTFKADPELQQVKQQVRSYLGRPWKEFSRTVIMESFLDDFIHPDGWMSGDDKSFLQTVFYTEFNNRGPASPKALRVKWPGVKEVPSSRIKRFTAARFLDGNRWISRRTVHYEAEFIFPVPKEDPNIKYSPVSTEETKDLGSSVETNNPESSNNKSETESPPPIPTPRAPTAASPASAPQSNKLARPTLSVVGAAAPAPTGGPDDETGDLVIDLSPIPAPASGISRPPFLSPDGSPDLTPSPRRTRALRPQRGGPASPALPRPPNGSPTSMPPLHKAASPTISPSGGSATTASPIPSASLSSQIARAPSFAGAEEVRDT